MSRSTVYFGDSGHGYSGQLDIVGSLARTESFPFIRVTSDIVDRHFG